MKRLLWGLLGLTLGLAFWLTIDVIQALPKGTSIFSADPAAFAGLVAWTLAAGASAAFERAWRAQSSR